MKNHNKVKALCACVILSAICIGISILLQGCGQYQLIITVDPEIKPYIERFEKEIGVNARGVSAVFGDLDYSVVGECVQYMDGSKKITIDRKYWANATDDEKEETSFHEAAHCYMGLGHIEGSKADSCPISIMNPYAFGKSICYSQEKEYYFEELRSHKH